MKLLALRPMLWVDDVEATIDYYVSMLGFEQGNYVEDWGWGFVTKDDVEIMFARPNEHTPYEKPQFSGSFYLNTDNVDDWWELLKDKANIFYAIEDFDWGMREFAIKDCNGYILQIGQEVIVQ